VACRIGEPAFAVKDYDIVKLSSKGAFMHELAAAQDVVKTALAAAEAEGARRIVAIVLEIGDLYGVDQMRELIAMEAQGTIAEGARLDIEPVAGPNIRVESIEVE
jgi:Zn finger protein HypA/HybF involved in hydrogenase expression